MLYLSLIEVVETRDGEMLYPGIMQIYMPGRGPVNIQHPQVKRVIAFQKARVLCLGAGFQKASGTTPCIGSP